MLRIHCLQLWFNLSDPAVEETLYDSRAMRALVGICLGRFRAWPTMAASSTTSCTQSSGRYAVAKRKIDSKRAAACPPYGIPRGCGFAEVGRIRTTPLWLNAGQPLELTCQIKDRGANCQEPGTLVTARVGGACDTQRRPVAGVR
jgi:hypothetical protein